MRVSEICKAAKEDTFRGRSEGLAFAQYVGVDGTSIWAAATSSSSAIQVQLLACMLARMFDASEATSVWVELVKDRRAEIGTRFQNNEELRFSVLTAATQAEISRPQLAEWDASARAWLRTADAVKTKQQKQLMLILDNLDLYVNNDIRVYSSVLAAAEKNRGIYWALSLAHLRFYGQPVLQTRELSSDSCRVTFEQLSKAALGALFAQWGLPLSRIRSGVEIIMAVSDALKRGLTRRPPADHEKWTRKKSRSPHWFYMISEAARYVSLSKGQDRDEALKLVKLGHRRSDMLAQTPTDDSNPFEMIPSPFSGLGDPAVFLNCLQSTEDRLQYLRKAAAKMCRHLPHISAKDIFIRIESDGGEAAYNLATALPGTNVSQPHERWLTRSRKVKGREMAVTPGWGDRSITTNTIRE